MIYRGVVNVCYNHSCSCSSFCVTQPLAWRAGLTVTRVSSSPVVMPKAVVKHDFPGSVMVMWLLELLSVSYDIKLPETRLYVRKQKKGNHFYFCISTPMFFFLLSWLLFRSYSYRITFLGNIWETVAGVLQLFWNSVSTHFWSVSMIIFCMNCSPVECVSFAFSQ